MTDPDTAGTDPLTAVIAEALADKFLCRTIPLHRDKPEHLCRTCKADKARMAAAVVAAVRAHQNTTQKAAAQALRDAADAMEAITVVDGVEGKQRETWNDCLRDYPHVKAPGNCLSPPAWLRNRADTLELS